MDNRKYLANSSIFCCSFLFLLFCYINITKAHTIYNFIGKGSLEDVNPTVKQKTQTQYKTEDKIRNQYKGKLKYRPDNGTKNRRSGRIYVGFYVDKHKLKVGDLKYNNEKYDRHEYLETIKKQNSFDIVMIAGYYLTNNLSFEFEYANYEYSIKLNNGKYLYFGGRTTTSYSVNKLNSDFTIYSLSLMLENNYSKLVPIFGAGLGYMKSGYADAFYVNNRDVETFRDTSDIRMKEKYVYIFTTGLDFSLTDNVLLSFRYKYINSLDARVGWRRLWRKKENETDTLDFKFVLNSYSLGVKYLW